MKDKDALAFCYAPTIWPGKRQLRMGGREQYREAIPPWAIRPGNLCRNYHRKRLRRYADEGSAPRSKVEFSAVKSLGWEERKTMKASKAGSGRNPRRGDLSSGGDQPGDVLQLEEEIRRTAADRDERLKQLEDENGKLRKLVADLSLDKEMLQDVIRRKL